MAQAFTNTTDINGLSYNINHVQNKTNIQDPDEYDYAPGAGIGIYDTVSGYLYSFLSIFINIVKFFKKKFQQIKETLKNIFETVEYSIYFIITIIVILLLYKFIYKKKTPDITQPETELKSIRVVE